MYYRTVLLLSLLLITPFTQAALPATLLEKYPGAHVYENSIELAAPGIAENGAVVPVSIQSLKLPANRYVTSVAFYNLDMQSCPIALFKTGTTSFAEGLAARIRVNNGDSPLYAIASLDNGDILSGHAVVKASFRCCSGGCDYKPLRLNSEACVNDRTSLH